MSSALLQPLPRHVTQPAEDLYLARGAWDVFLVVPAAEAYALEPLGRVAAPAVLPRCSDVELDGSVYRVAVAPTQDAESAPLAGAAIDAWINGAVAVSQWSTDSTVGESVAALAAGERVACAAGHTAATAKLVLVRVLTGRFRVSGGGGKELGAGAEMMLPREVALTALEDGVLEVMRLGAVDERARLGALHRLWDATLANACVAHHGRAQADLLQVDTRRARLERDFDRGMGALKDLLGKASPARDAADQAGAAQAAGGLVPVFQVVAKELGVAFDAKQAPRGAAAGGPAQLRLLADFARVRCREVTLTQDWWRYDSGPIIAFCAADYAPLALIPDGRGHYRAHFRPGGEGRTVDEAFAQTLQPLGFVFYRPLPDKALTDLDLLRFGLGAYRNELGMAVVLSGIAGTLGLVFPLASAKLVDSYIPEAQVTQVLQLGLGLVMVALVQTLLSLTRALTILRIQDKMDLAIQAAVWDRVLHMPVSFYRRFTVARLATRVRNCTKIIRIYSAGTVAAILHGGFSVLNFVVLFMFSGALSLIALGLVALAAAAVTLFRRRAVRIRIDAPQSPRNVSTLVLQMIQGITKLRTTAAEARAFGVWASEYALGEVPNVKTRRLRVFERVFFRGLDHIAVLVLFAVAGAILFSSSRDHLSAGEFVGFFAAFGGVFHGVLALCETLVSVVNVASAYHMARPILETVPESESGKLDPGPLSGAIEVRGLSFAYPGGEPVLENVSFTVKPGDFVAVVGRSGSGKSTLLRLLLAFDRPTAGSIFYDANDLSDLRLRQLRRQFGVVLQDTRLLAGDLLSNIVGDSGATLEDAWEAAAAAAVDKDIHDMPMGMHTVVDEGGSTLSSGQRQRILIARALIGHPRVLFFDEATSVLDGLAQAKVTENLKNRRATRILIGMRTSSLADADLILVLERGHIVQQGRYDELAAQPGIFAELLAERKGVAAVARAA